MSATEAEGNAVIRSGPRWDDVLAAVDVAEEALGAPLSDDELDEGWSDEGRVKILEDVRRVRDELVERPDTSAVLERWRGLEPADGDGLRLDPILDVDLALGELERAEDALVATAEMLVDLSSEVSSSDRDAGFDEAARERLRTMVQESHDLLVTGAYLTGPLMDAWADALRGYGFLRGAPAPGVRDDAAAEGFVPKRIEQFPPGRRWERVAIFDGRLLAVAITDVLAEEPEGEGVDKEAADGVARD